ncbi:MAG: DUF4293 domain-containing protein [Chlorobiaceae bacterium]|nr:DUF4293 domain-containing protein [Chlorobiaceae bacterium]
MLARIQSLYLFLAALFAVASMFFPFWSFSSGQVFIISDLSASQLSDVTYSIACFAGSAFSPLTALISIVAVFLYKNRDLQNQLIIVAFILFIGDLFSGFAAAHFMNQHFLGTGTAITHKPEAGLFLMLPEPVLFILALQGVKKDDKIANAYKRL